MEIQFEQFEYDDEQDQDEQNQKVPLQISNDIPVIHNKKSEEQKMNNKNIETLKPQQHIYQFAKPSLPTQHQQPNSTQTDILQLQEVLSQKEQQIKVLVKEFKQSYQILEQYSAHSSDSNYRNDFTMPQALQYLIQKETQSKMEAQKMQQEYKELQMAFDSKVNEIKTLETKLQNQSEIINSKKNTTNNNNNLNLSSAEKNSFQQKVHMKNLEIDILNNQIQSQQRTLQQYEHLLQSTTNNNANQHKIAIQQPQLQQQPLLPQPLLSQQNDCKQCQIYLNREQEMQHEKEKLQQKINQLTKQVSLMQRETDQILSSTAKKRQHEKQAKQNKQNKQNQDMQQTSEISATLRLFYQLIKSDSNYEWLKCNVFEADFFGLVQECEQWSYAYLSDLTKINSILQVLTNQFLKCCNVIIRDNEVSATLLGQSELMQQKIYQLEDQVEDLTMYKETAKSGLQSKSKVETDFQSAMRACEQLQAKLQESQKMMNEKQEQFEQAENQITELNEKLASNGEDINDKANEIQNLTNEMNKLAILIKTYQREQTMQKHIINSVFQHILNSSAQQQALDRAVEINQSLQQLEQERDDIAETLSTQEQNLSSLIQSEQIDSLQVVTLRRAIEKLKGYCATVQSQCDGTEQMQKVQLMEIEQMCEGHNREYAEQVKGQFTQYLSRAEQGNELGSFNNKFSNINGIPRQQFQQQEEQNAYYDDDNDKAQFNEIQQRNYNQIKDTQYNQSRAKQNILAPFLNQMAQIKSLQIQNSSSPLNEQYREKANNSNQKQQMLQQQQQQQKKSQNSNRFKFATLNYQHQHDFLKENISHFRKQSQTLQEKLEQSRKNIQL